jgi:5-methylcytosine-specific restriction protein A
MSGQPARRATKKPCPTDRCPNLTEGGPCAECRADREKRRGTPWQRGYRQGHLRRFRPAVLAKNHGLCCLCNIQPATVADHWPLSRRELVLAGADPDDPQHGRPLCAPCHSVATAEHQPGGWNVRDD